MMRKDARSVIGSLFLSLGATILVTAPVHAQQVLSAAKIPTLRHLGLSRPLREGPPPDIFEQRRIIPLRPVPHKASTGQTDPVVQLSTATQVATAPGLNFEGVGSGAYGYTVKAAPPDTIGAVGSTQYLQWVNLAYAVFDKATGTLLAGPTAGNALFAGFPTSVSNCAVTNDGDVIVRYDAQAQRWLLAQLSFSNAPPYEECIAVSTSSDATGTYNLYTLQWSNDLPDYPKWGVWPDAYYFSANMFFGEILFVGAEGCALDRNLLLSGGTPTADSVQCFIDSGHASWLPSDLDGATTPPAGEPNFYLNLGTNSLNLWKFHVDFTNSANTTFTGPTGVAVAAFNEACGGGTCIPQAGTSQQLDSLGDRLMYRLAYRNFTNHESLVVTHSVNPGGGSRHKNSSTTGVSAIRWYELRNPNGTPFVYQQGTFAPDTNARWMGSMATDKVGDIAVGYSVSSTALHPAIRYTGRVPTDTLNTLEAESSIFEGPGSQTGNLSRWGDYSGMSVDPADDCTFYYTTEYHLASGSFNWNTRIASFKFPGCQ
jgi:hypothetical protein